MNTKDTSAFIALRSAPWRANVCDQGIPFEVWCRGRLISVILWLSTGYGGYLPTADGKLKQISGADEKTLREEVNKINFEYLLPCPGSV